MTTGTFQFGGISNVTIPTTGGIWINGATFGSGNYSIINNGWIQVSAGTANFSTGSGNAVHTQNRGYFQVSGGSVNISGRLENTASGSLLTGIPGTGVSISDGTITLATVGNAASNTGSFDMSTSSTLDVSGGTIVFQNPSTAASPLDINIVSGGTKSIYGGTFQIGNASTPANSTFMVNSAIDLFDFTINSINTPSARLVSNNLNIDDKLTLSGGILDAATNSLTVLVANGTAASVTRTAGFVTGNLARYPFFGTITFDVGTGTAAYSPIKFFFQSGSGSFDAFIKVRVYNVKHPQNSSNTNYLNRYWDISDSAWLLPPVYNITSAQYFASDVAGSEASIFSAEYPAALPWVKYNAANTGSHIFIR